MAACVHATVAWLEDPAVGLGDRLDRGERELHAMATRADGLPQDAEEGG